MLGITTTAETGERRKEEEKVIDKKEHEDRERKKKSYTWTYKYGENKKKTDKKKGVGWGWGGYVIDKEHGERQKAKGDEEQKEK